jgi:hypothetical protein
MFNESSEEEEEEGERRDTNQRLVFFHLSNKYKTETRYSESTCSK